MQSLYEVDLQKKIDLLIETYNRTFLLVFGTKPSVTDRDIDSARSLLNRINISQKQIQKLVDEYLCLDDDWTKTKGYPLGLLSEKYNLIATKAGIKPQYVVGFADTGEPITSTNKTILKSQPLLKWEPILLSEWLKLDYQQKIRLSPDSPWSVKEHEWEKKLREWGFFD